MVMKIIEIIKSDKNNVSKRFNRKFSNNSGDELISSLNASPQGSLKSEKIKFEFQISGKMVPFRSF